MEYADDAQRAANYLRQAIPLMVKHRVAPHPVNYALWYTYVSKRLPSLNAELDRAIETFGTCPAGLEVKLFRDHLVADEVEEANRIHSALISLATSMTQSATEAAAQTSHFSGLLEESLQALKKTEGSAPLASIAESLYRNTMEVSGSNEQFQRRLFEAQQEITRLKQELAAVRDDAYRDALTQLYNRRFLMEALEQACADSDQTGVCLIIADIDHFKDLNDQYGHTFGDQVLQNLGRLFASHCGEAADPVRYGGEEFVILLRRSTGDEAAALAEKLRRKIQKIRIRHRRSGTVISSISASFGVAVRNRGDTPAQLIGRADDALYQAKHNGRNCVKIHSDIDAAVARN